MSRSLRSAAVAVVFAALASACGGVSGTSSAAETTAVPPTSATSAAAATTVAPATTTTPATAAATTIATTAPTTTAAPTTTTTAAPTLEEIAAEHGLPLKDGSTLISHESFDDRTEIAIRVDAAPPPNYVDDLAAAGWDVADVQFGSETGAGHDPLTRRCVIYYANYVTPDTGTYWMWIMTAFQPDPEACYDAIQAWKEEFEDRGQPW